MKARARSWFIVLLGVWLGAWGWGTRAFVKQEASLWQPLPRVERLPRGATDTASQWRLNAAALRQLLATAPLESPDARSQTILPLPLPDGRLAQFAIEESPLFEPALAAQFPEIKSYRGHALDVPGLTMRGAWSAAGFHATLLQGGEVISLWPAPHDATLYFSQAGAADAGQFVCQAQETNSVAAALAPAVAIGDQLRTYRIAIAATWEYANAYGNGTNAGTLASLNIWLNAVNALFERELSVRLTLAGGTNLLFTTERGFNAGNDPFDNANVLTMQEQVRPVLRDLVGVNNYDLGHVLGANAGFSNQGAAGLGVVCNNAQFNPLTGNTDQQGPIKARGASTFGASQPAGDSRALSIWAHELGHQFGAHHSYNAASGFCGSQRNGPTAVEPGGGVTWMSYTSICDADNVALSRDLRFHNSSFREVQAYLNSVANCGTLSAKANRIPTVNGGADYIIPRQTPFTLTATGSDGDAGDMLTYAWEQVDAGEAGFANPPYGDQPGDPPTTTRPLFRSFPATASPSRTFPSLTYILNNANTPPAVVGNLQTAEVLPSVPRALNFRVTIRDQRGGVNEDAVRLAVDGTGPFRLTAPNTAVNWTGGSVQTVTWSVNGTQTLAANVRLLLSTDGGQSFPAVLLANAANNGNASFTVPNNVQTTQARLRLEALGNIFFDISDANFSITPTCSFSLSPTAQGFASTGGAGNVAVKAAASTCAWRAASNDAWLTLTAGAAGTGDGAVSYSVAALTGAPRTGTLTIAGQSFTITQLAPQTTLANVSAASFTGPELAPESIAAAFGTALATATQAAPSVPLPTTLAGTQVKVRDSANVERAAPLFFVSASQVNYQVPPGSASGVATVTITNANGASSTGNVIVAPVVPGLFTANANGRDVPAGVLVRARGGQQQFETLARLDTASNRFVAIPIDLGPETDVVVAVLFGTGWRQRRALDTVEVRLVVGTQPPLNVPVAFAGVTPGLVGLDQLNFTLPRALAGRGAVDVLLNVEGKPANVVRLSIR